MKKFLLTLMLLGIFVTPGYTVSSDETCAHIPNEYLELNQYYKLVFYRTMDIQYKLKNVGIEDSNLNRLKYLNIEKLLPSTVVTILGIECHEGFDISQAQIFKASFSGANFTSYNDINDLNWSKIKTYCGIDRFKMMLSVGIFRYMDEVSKEIFAETCGLYKKYPDKFETIVFPEKIYCSN